MSKVKRAARAVVMAASMVAGVAAADRADAAITYTIHGDNNRWGEQRRNAAIDSMNRAVGRFNAHGGFDKHINVFYEPGVPTAEASYNGDLRYGGTYPNERVTIHEIEHTLGSGTIGEWYGNFPGGVWSGPRVQALIQQFDGRGAVLRQAGQHFYDYGLNFDSEGGDINSERSVALMYAMRGDMGVGPGGPIVTQNLLWLTDNDAVGESAFNYNNRWNDRHFAHTGATYTTGNFVMRTPATDRSYDFAGSFMRLNNRANPNGGLWYTGQGTGGVLNFNFLILDGGSIHHMSGAGDLMQLTGRLAVASPSMIRAANGSINVLAPLSGSADLTIQVTNVTDPNNGVVRLMSSANDFTGDLIVNGRFELANNANYRFIVRPDGDANAIIGTNSLRRVRLNGVFQIDVSGAAGEAGEAGDSWSLVAGPNVTYGNTFRVDGFTRITNGLWVGANGYRFSEQTGRLSVVPEPTTLALAGSAGLMFVRRRRPTDVAELSA